MLFWSPKIVCEDDLQLDPNRSLTLSSECQACVRGRILQALHSRPMLIFVCTLVILECMCVMAELMVDLHGIRVRFDHEEEQLQKFVEKFSSENESCTKDSTNLYDLVDMILNIKQNYKSVSKCQTTTGSQQTSFQTCGNVNTTPRPKRSANIPHMIKKLLANQRRPMTRTEPLNFLSGLGNQRPFSFHSKVRKRSTTNNDKLQNTPQIFMFSMKTQSEDYFVVSSFEEVFLASLEACNTSVVSHSYQEYLHNYEKIQKISHIVKYLGFSILSIMVLETLLKLVCLGFMFFRKKIEVFDAFIVLISFALDVVFIDSRWYETGKDATTILVLLLPWRIIRIINSFIMTINRKHYIQLMTIKKSKKRILIKLKKLRHLMIEMRRDIDLLITLAKTKGATDPEVFNCIYGKGRGTKSLTAITSFASLMFISTLGKDPSGRGAKDEMYGELIRDIIGDDEEDEDEDDDTDMDKTNTDSTEDKDEFTEFPRVGTVASFVEHNGTKPKSHSIRQRTSESYKSESAKISRRVTLPRRNKSCSEEEPPVFYINDAYEGCDDVKAVIPKLYTKREVRSLPHICSTVRGKNFVTLEVTTQVTYL